MIEGRGFWQNMRRGLGLLLGGNLGELGLIVGASALGAGAPLNTQQILVVNLITDALPALAVVLQQPEHRHLAGLAREGLTALDEGLRGDVLRRGLATALPALAAYLFLRGPTGTAEASSVAFASIVANQLAQTLDAGWVENHVSGSVSTAVAVSAGLLVGALTFPPVRTLLGLTTPSLFGWSVIGGSALSAVALSRTLSHANNSVTEPMFVSKNRTRMNTDETDFHGSDKKEIHVNPSHPCSSVFSCLAIRAITLRPRRRFLSIMNPSSRKLARCIGWTALLIACVALPLLSAPAKQDKPAPKPSREPIQFDATPLTFQAVHGIIWSAAFGPDGKTLVSAGGGWDKPGDLVVWDTTTRKPRVRLRVNPGLRSVAVSRDGKILATAGYSEPVAHVRDAATGKVLHVLRHNEAINGVALSPDGRLLATAGLGRTVTVWDLGTRKEKATMTGHEANGVFAVAFSGDGKSVISCGADQTARIWDANTGKEKVVLRGHTKPIEYALFSPDGRMAATASWDRTIKLWDAGNGKELATLTGHKLSILCLAFSPDGKLLASGSGVWSMPETADQPGELKLWDVAQRKELATLAGHTDRIWSVSFSRDGKTLASAGWDKTVRLWDVAKRKELTVLQVTETPDDEQKPIVAGAYAPESNVLAVGDEDGTVRLLDTDSGEVRRILKGHADAVTCVAFAPGGKVLATGSPDRLIKLWDADRGKELRTLRGHTNWIYALSFSPDGKTLASGSYDRTVRLWDVDKGTERKVLKGHKASVRAVAFAPDGKTLASAGSDHVLKLWDVAGTNETITLKGHSDAVRAVAFSADGKTLASAGDDNSVKLWDVAAGKERTSLAGHNDAVAVLTFSPGGLLASAGLDRTIHVWDSATGKQRATLRGHSEPITVLQFTDDGSHLYSAGLDKTVKRWKGSRDLVRLFEGHTGPIRRMAISPDGRQLLSASGFPKGDGTARLWDVHTGKELRRLQEPLNKTAVMGPREGPGEIQTVAISADGRRALTGGSNNVVHLWDLQTGKLLRSLKGHGGTIYNVAFAADGRQAASGSRDGTIRLWDLDNGKEVRRLEGHNNWVLAVGYSPDGKRLLSRGMDNTMRLWDVATGKELKRLENMGGGIPGLAWFPDGRRVLIGQGRFVQIWDVEAGKELRRIDAHPASTTSVALSRDGRRALSSGYGGSVRLWDVETGRELKHLAGHRNWVMSVLFTPDGRHALTGGGGRNGPEGPQPGEDFAIRLWELPSSQ